ncbi:hypothetical protein L7O55_24970 [Escherichia coli]|uniref:hypothetical protein n=1 Tax=Escherichia coli TaxID=562 RepID=UPI002ED64F5B
MECNNNTRLNAPDAVAFVENRSLTHPELVAAFKLGFANRTLPYRLPAVKSRAGEKIRARLSETAVVRDRDHEYSPGPLVCPLNDPYGTFRWTTGRKHRCVLPAETPPHMHVPTPTGGP